MAGGLVMGRQERCKATTKSGNPCRSFSVSEAGYCRAHDPAYGDRKQVDTCQGGEGRKDTTRPAKTMARGQAKTHKPKPLAPGTYVDAPYPFQCWKYGKDFPGYLVRWSARKEFLDKGVELIPTLLPSLLTNDAITLASRPAQLTTVNYAANVRPHDQVLEHVLFARDDRLFEGVNWNAFDPHQDPRVSKLTERHQRYILWLGEAGIVAFWQLRIETRKHFGFPVWKALTMFSASESDGESTIELLRCVDSDLRYHIHAWASRWHLNIPWVFMVATATVCEAARCQSTGNPMPEQFVFPKNWEDWYVDLLGKPGGPKLAKRPQRRQACGDHMNWVIQRHFMNRTAKDIADSESVTQQMVDQQTRRLSHLIHLNMRRARSGRPRRRRGRSIKHRSTK